MNKSLKDKAIKFKGKDYVEVKERILYLSNEIKDYSISTDYKYFENQKMWVVKATLIIGNNSYTGLAQEIEDTSFINKTSALENAETSAVGRACAMAGIGVIDSIASVDEINKANNRPAKNHRPRFNEEQFKELEEKKKNGTKEDLDKYLIEIKEKYDFGNFMKGKIKSLLEK